jgi:hypothetical protein
VPAFSVIGCFAAVIAMPALLGYPGRQVFMAVEQAILYAVIRWGLVPRSATGAKFEVGEIKATSAVRRHTKIDGANAAGSRAVRSGLLTLAMILYRVPQPLFNWPQVESCAE